jgi:Zn-dependent protease with chaperone function
MKNLILTILTLLISITKKGREKLLEDILNYGLTKGEISMREDSTNNVRLYLTTSPVMGLLSNYSAPIAFALTSIGRVIFVNSKYFYSLPDYVQEFIYFHELGHLELHSKLIDVIQIKLNIESLKKEFEADKYASDILGKEKAIQALVVIKDWALTEFDEDFDTTEIDLRILKLRHEYSY